MRRKVFRVRAPTSQRPPEGYRLVPPAPPLRPFVECLWVHVIDDADPHEDLRILPDGRMDLVWVEALGAVVAGPQSRSTDRPHPAPFLAFGARFHPGAAPIVLGLPASDFLNDHVPLAAVDARLAARLEDRLGEARDEWEAFAALDDELLRCLDGLGHPAPAMRAAVALLARPRAAVADVAARVGVSERQLERRFVEAVGYGPKTLQRVLRLQGFIADLGSRTARVGLAEAAWSAGYADQAHLSRESRRLAGLSPRELVDWLGRPWPGGAGEHVGNVQ